MCVLAGRAGGVSDEAGKHDDNYFLGVAAGRGAGVLGEKGARTCSGITQTDDG